MFNTTTDALRLLGCRRKDYHEGEKNIWHVTLPEFISHEIIKQKPNKLLLLDSLENSSIKVIDRISNLSKIEKNKISSYINF